MRDRLLEALLFFLERPSVTGREKQLCDDLERRISASRGWETQRIANNLVVRRTDQDFSQKRIVFAGHLDTVPEPARGLPVRVEGEKVYGRGASDMKAGDAVMLALLENFRWEESGFEPIFVFYEREEGDYAENGLQKVFGRCPQVLEAGLALVLEPTAGALEVGCVGTAQVEVTFRGRAAHAARPWLGKNALTAAGEFLARLHEFPAEAVEIGGLTFYEVLTPTMARSGVAKNVVPDEFWINVNHRFVPGRGIEHVRSVFEGLLENYPDTSYEISDFAAGGPVDMENPLLQKFISSGIEVGAKQGWTDVARFAQRGLAAANFGPGLPEQCHQDLEHADIPLLETCYRRLEKFLAAG